MSRNMNDVFDSLHSHDEARDRPDMSNLLENHSVITSHEAPGASSKSEYGGEEESIDTEPLPHSPNQNSQQTNTMDQQPQTTMQGNSYPAMVHGSPIGHKDHSAASTTGEYDMTHHHIQQLPYGNTNAMPGMQMNMMWGTSEHGVLHPGDKPKRPLSAYNFFFQLERERIIKGDSDDKDKEDSYTVEDVARIALIQQRKAKENKPKPKRSHRKTHGKISFGDLARTIANKWKKLDEKTKAIFEGSASIEKERYKKELAEWTKKQKKWKDATTRLTLQNAGGGAYLLPEAAYGIVTPTQLPKKTVASAEVPGNSPGQSSNASTMMASMASTASADSQQQWDSQQQQQHRFGTGMDYPQGMYNSGENDYMNDNGQDNHYDYDDVTNETYNMAQMTLPQPRPNAYQQRMIMHQRRMRMLMMQQRQNMAAGLQNQAMMRMLRQGGANLAHPFNMDDFDHQSFASEGNYTGQQQHHTADGATHDDASTFLDSHSQGFMMNSGESHDMSTSQHNDGQMGHEDDFQPLLHHGGASAGDDDFQPHPLNHSDSTVDEFTPIML